MPNKDGTGPNWKGPKTGRWLGNCTWETKWNWEWRWQWRGRWNWKNS